MLGAHNWGVGCLISRYTYLRGVPTLRGMELTPRSLGPYDIHLGDLTLDSRIVWLRSIIHGGW